MKPKFSIIVPLYNSEKFIEKCLDSFIHQTYSNFEVIVIDDESTDNSFEIAEKFENEKIKIIRKKNGGVSEARNTGIQYAIGEYLLFVDSDDFLEYNALETINLYLDEKPDLLYFNYIIDTWSRNETLINVENKTIPNIVTKNTIDIEFLEVIGYVWNKVYKKEFIHKHKLSFEKHIHLYEDVIFNINFLMMNPIFLSIDEHLYHYQNRHRKSLVKSYNENILNCVLKVDFLLEKFLNSSKFQFIDKKKIQSESLMKGIRHYINSLFSYSDANNQFILSKINEVVNRFEFQKTLKYYVPTTRTDYVYKNLLLKKQSYLIFLIFKILKK